MRAKWAFMQPCLAGFLPASGGGGYRSLASLILGRHPVFGERPGRRPMQPKFPARLLSVGHPKNCRAAVLHAFPGKGFT